MPFLELTDNQVQDIVNVNVLPAMMLCHAILPDMVKKGRGAIVNISSLCSAFPVPYLAVYAATKSFIGSFTRAVSAEYENRLVFNSSCLEFKF